MLSRIPRVLGGAALGALCGVMLTASCAGAAGELLSGDALLTGDAPPAAVMQTLILLGTPIAFVAGAVLGGRICGFADRRLLAAVGGGLLGIVVIYLIAIPVSIIYGGAIDPTGVEYLLVYGVPFAVFFGARGGRRRFDRARQSRMTE